jgi:chromosome segregation ATPase
MISYAKLVFITIAVVLVAWSYRLVHQSGAEGVRLEVAQQALKQIERAQDETRDMQEKLNAAQQNYTQAQADIGQRDGRIRALNDRMRNTPTAKQLANASPAALSRYAAEADRDFAECRDRYAALGSTAARASAAAWAHREGWPTIERESINQSRETLRSKQ